MKKDLFHRYVWLIDTVRHAKNITFDELADLWRKDVSNFDGSTLALRTFHNHRDAIEYLFGIHIACDRSSHTYYIQDTDAVDSINLKVWMLQTLNSTHQVELAGDVNDRILLDSIPEEKRGLLGVLEAMRQSRKINIVNYPGAADGESVLLAPYCIKYWDHAWYVLGEDSASGEMRIFRLDGTLRVESSDEGFNYPYGFSPREFFNDVFGMDINTRGETEEIVLSLGGDAREKVRRHPLHHSQNELPGETGGRSIFTYRVIPSDYLLRSVLAMGEDAEIIAPQHMRERMAGLIGRIAEKY